MKKIIITAAIIATILGFSANKSEAQNSYKTASDTGIARILGFEPEEFIRNDTWYTSNGNVDFDFMYGNGQHAYFDPNNAYFTGDKTAIITKFEPFSNDEKNTIIANNGFGIYNDTSNKVIKDLDDRVLANFTDYASCANKTEDITNEIVKEDIDVQVIGVVDKMEDSKVIYMNGNNLQIIGEGKYYILVLDISGRHVAQQYGNDQTIINMSDMTKGIYKVTIFNKTGKHTENIINIK